MLALIAFVHSLLEVYMWIFVAGAVFSWLIAFNVVNAGNQLVDMVGKALYLMTEPVLRPIRRILPTMGGLDLSPLVAIVIILFLRDVVVLNVFQIFDDR